MIFSSAIFLFVFLPIVLVLYYLSDYRFRNVILFAASLFFYAWGEPGYVFLMILSILLNWFTGILIDRVKSRRVAFLILSAGVTINIIILVYFKYFTFFASVIISALSGLYDFGDQPEAIPLPAGISFFTFHAISYIVDIYRGQAGAIRNPLTMGLYISLFPQLVAGPIIRFHDIAEQLKLRVNSYERFGSGIERFVFGLAKKLLIANPLGQVADAAFATAAADLSTPTAWLGITCYTLQIYFDFSGYSDMAIGLGRMFGFEFPENFNYPYISRSVREFWRRWHISLSTWFRDYLYIPLGGSRASKATMRINLIIVFLLCGLWHGASWNFLVWGAFHGALLSLERGPFGSFQARLPRPLAHAYTIFMVMIGWVFFKADTLSHAVGFLHAMSGLSDAVGIAGDIAPLVTPKLPFVIAAGVLLSTPIATFWARDWRTRRFPSHSKEPYPSPLGEWLDKDGPPIFLARALLVPILFALCVSELASATYNPFIYFRF
ncbi:MBOAT family protein [Bosea caraganae]|uniref:Probable alginate O-acetylase AlgI n=1 Tax=Bosea caraganae TaxID=2763117 RepID=A0A370L879_9HYPH|nr:MBOAT family protein [Bosea caraganae]RDJ25972.1 MBOAT family protein [Bosea caraganae]